MVQKEPMTLTRPTIVLFDMDGTTVRHLNPRLLTVLEVLDDWTHKMAGWGSKVFKRRISAVPLVEHRDGKRPKLLVHRALHKFRRKEVDQIVEPCPGIYDVLDFLKDNNIRIGLISNGLGKGYGHDILEKFDLEKYYEVTLFREDSLRAKPHPDLIIKALERLSPPPTKDDVIWYFGDRRKDILTAIAAKDYLPCPLLPFAYNLHAAVAVLEHNIGTDHIVMAWPDLLGKIKTLMKG